MTIQEKINQLYIATRIASLNADQHAALQQHAKDILEALKEPEPEIEE
jgi:hypothetical protein